MRLYPPDGLANGVEKEERCELKRNIAVFLAEAS
jgi:hypothetical protein